MLQVKGISEDLRKIGVDAHQTGKGLENNPSQTTVGKMDGDVTF